MRHPFLIAVFLSLTIILNIQTISAQDATPLSLQQCIDYALKHNYTVKNAALDVLIQKAQNGQAASNAYPHINGSVQFTDFAAPQYQFIDAHNFPGGDTIPKGTIIGLSFTLPYSNTISATASQVLFDGNLFVALKARKTVLDLARLNGEVTKENVRYNVTKAYNALVVAYKQFDIIRTSLGFARNIQRDLEIIRQNGLAEKIEVERTSVQVNNLASDSIRISNLLEVSEQLLKYQMGMDLSMPIVLTDTNLEENKNNALALLDEKQDYEKLPAYNALLTQVKLGELNVLRYKLTAIPTLSVFATQGTNYGHTNLSEIFNATNYKYPYFFAGAQLNVPIFNGFMRTSQLKEAKLNLEKAQNGIEYMKQGIDFQAEQARTMLRNALLQVENQRRNMEVATDVLDLAQKKYKAGVGSNQEVTQAQTDLLQSQNNYFSALLDLANAEADLEKALGLLK